MTLVRGFEAQKAAWRRTIYGRDEVAGIGVADMNIRRMTLIEQRELMEQGRLIEVTTTLNTVDQVDRALKQYGLEVVYESDRRVFSIEPVRRGSEEMRVEDATPIAPFAMGP